MRIIAIIPARGGSKGLPGKNVMNMAGKPLIAWSIKHCLESELVNEVYVSSDDEAILSVAREYGASPVLRPAELASDHASSEVALMHVMQTIKQPESVDYVVFLQPTSPLREKADLDKAIRQIVTSKSDSLLSVTPHRDHFLWRFDDKGTAQSLNYDYNNRKPRQKIEETFLENGSFYIFKPKILLELKNRLGGKIDFYQMPKLYSFQIDSYEDFQICEKLISLVGLEMQ